MAKTMCKASDDKRGENAAKAAERLAGGKACFRCERCGRTSHKDDHLCKPEKVKPEKKVKPDKVKTTGAEEPVAAAPAGADGE